MDDSTKERLEAAIKDAGGFTVVAERITRANGYVYPSLIRGWIKRSIPAPKVIAFEDAIHGKVSRHEMRPDVFGPSPSKDKETDDVPQTNDKDDRC